MMPEVVEKTMLS